MIKIAQFRPNTKVQQQSENLASAIADNVDRCLGAIACSCNHSLYL